MEHTKLPGTDLKVSRIGFGAATLGDEYGRVEPAEITRAVHFAIDNGMNFIDVAPYYGRTLAESRLGEALKGRRDKAVLATKCARYDKAGFDFSAKRVTASVDESLQRLQTDYLDIIHVHDVEFGDWKLIAEETIPALRRAQEAGKARWVGITGLGLTVLRRIAEHTPVDCILSYCRYNLMNKDLDTILTPFAKEHNIGLINASPLHMGVLTENGPPAWHPSTPEMREIGRRVVELCKKRGYYAPSVGLRYATENPYVSCTFSGISTVEECKNNMKVLETPNDSELIAEIERIVAPIRGCMWPSGLPENYDPMMETPCPSKI